MKKFVFVDGNTACSNIAYQLSEVVEIYPITPSSGMAENCDELQARGQKNIFDQSVLIRQMQSEAGVAGALHGSLSAGALSTTFTSSQGLLLMLPNMLKIAGELLPCVFHVSARALATHALSIFGDHSDVMAVRASGFNMIASTNVQEAQDMALVAHIASLNSSLPFLHFFDGFRTSHEVQKIQAIQPEEIKKIFPFEKLLQFRAKRLDPQAPVQKGTAQNPDIFFQNREACNLAYQGVRGAVQSAMQAVESITSRHYEPVEYYGSDKAKFVMVIMGSGFQTAKTVVRALNLQGEKLGVINIRLYRPFLADLFVQKLPKTVQKIVVLDRTKELGATAEPLCQDVIAALQNAGKTLPVVGGRYGLGGKEFTPACVKACFDNLKQKNPIQSFSVGICDDVTHKSLPMEQNFALDESGISMKFYGLGSDGTVSANKNSIKIIGEKTGKFVQGYFEYDSKKSGSMTVSHLRVSDEQICAPYLVTAADLIAVHNFNFVARYDLLKDLKKNGTVLLNTALSNAELSKSLPCHFVEKLKTCNAKLFAIDAAQIAQNAGLGNKINVIMQGAFFKITNFLAQEEIFEELKTATQKTYGKKGEQVVQNNITALEKAFSEVRRVDVQSLVGHKYAQTKTTNNQYFLQVVKPINDLCGNNLPVSTFSPDGSVPTGTTQFEKRGIGQQCPTWKCENCLQCGLCSLACPHGAIRAALVKKSALKNAPNSVTSKPATGESGLEYVLAVSALDCTGCGVCAKVCPAKNKALEMMPTSSVLDQNTKILQFLENVKTEKANYPLFTPKGLQFEKPYFEFNYACPGCGETPYLKLLTTLFGKDMVIANATGCSSIYGGSAPACPYTKDKSGCGPAWANSLFEDNAEFGYGIYLGFKAKKRTLQDACLTLFAKTKFALFNKFLNGEELTSAEQQKLCQKLVQIQSNAKVDEKIRQAASVALENKTFFGKKSVWIVGGDGWAYDIGFGGLDHVLASGENVNILVLDTEVYSNTGGQSSKSTPQGACAKFAISGKNCAKKNLGAIAMTYPNVYVAQIALGANPMQAINAFCEAEKHDGVSLIIAYAPCINHGIDMSNSYHEMKKAVETGYWNIYRRRPKTDVADEELLVDSTPTKPYQDFLNGENRFKMLAKTNPSAAKNLFEQSEFDAKNRREELNKLKNK